MIGARLQELEKHVKDASPAESEHIFSRLSFVFEIMTNNRRCAEAVGLSAHPFLAQKELSGELKGWRRSGDGSYGKVIYHADPWTLYQFHIDPLQCKYFAKSTCLAPATIYKHFTPFSLVLWCLRCLVFDGFF